MNIFFFPVDESKVRIIFSFLSFEISECILRNQKKMLSVKKFSNQRVKYLAPFRLHYPVERCKSTLILFGSMLPNRVTEEALVAETAVWPMPFLINMFTALIGSRFYFIYIYLIEVKN